MKKILSIALCALLASFSLMAQNEKLASTASLPTLIMGTEAASLTGASSVARGEGAFAMDNNVAAMPFTQGRMAAAVSFGMFQPSYSKDNYLGAGVIFKATDALAFGLSFRDRLEQPYQATSGSGADVRDGIFTPGEYNLAFGASYAFIPSLSAGVSLRMVNSSLTPEVKGSAFAADIALAYRKSLADNSLSAGLSLNNLGTKIKYGEKSLALPMLIKAGAAFDYAIKGSTPMALNASLEAQMLFAGGLMANIGLEYRIKEMLAVRCGYHYGDGVKTIPSYASAGLGFKLAGVRLDAAYIFASETLGNSLSLTLGYEF